MRSVSIIIPTYNEAPTIQKVIQAVVDVKLPIKKQIIVVDDGSTDGSGAIIQGFTLRQPKILSFSHKTNRGKGAAIRTALKRATGDFIIIQDADLESDPKDIRRILAYARAHKADAVFGTRHHQKNTHLYPHYSWGGTLVTKLANLLYGLHLTDMGCCYKLIKRSVIQKMNLKENRFGFCAEVTARLAIQKIPIAEVPISYRPRTFAQGKKIRIQDGLRLCAVLIACRLRAYS
jgi:glycosyltransferase involved in cell wall biosynthesis